LKQSGYGHIIHNMAQPRNTRVQVLPLTYTLSVRRFNKLAVRQCIISLRLQEYLFTCFPSLLSSNFQFPFFYYHVYLHIYCYNTRVLMIYEWHLDHKEAKSRVGKLVIYWHSFNFCVCVWIPLFSTSLVSLVSIICSILLLLCLYLMLIIIYNMFCSFIINWCTQNFNCCDLHLILI
jgi:hypothetical protein